MNGGWIGWTSSSGQTMLTPGDVAEAGESYVVFSPFECFGSLDGPFGWIFANGGDEEWYL